MTVLLDASSIPADSGGVGRYLTELIPALARTDSVVVHVACRRRDRGWLAASAPDAVLHEVPDWVGFVPARLLWEQVGLPLLARDLDADVIHSPHYTMPLLSRRGRVVTLHDATFFSHPELHGRLKRHFFSFWIRASSRLADVCITPSRATASEVGRYVGASRAAFVVSFHGVDSSRYSPESRRLRSDLVDATGIGDTPYLAFIGTIEPRKNVGPLLDAVTRLATRRPDLAPRLLLAGGAGWDVTSVARLRSADASAPYRWLGYLDEAFLPTLLSSAELVAYPSSGEGFGLPILEAMASGVPVLTTARLAAPEVGGDAVLYCEPTVDGIESALETLLDDAPLRADLALRGRERALGFTWDRTAAQHVDAYRQATSR